MQIKTNKVLLTILLTTLNELDTDFYFNGICGLNFKLLNHGLINAKEYDKLHRYIKKHRPNKQHQYSWPMYCKPPRVEWLEQQIKLLSK